MPDKTNRESIQSLYNQLDLEAKELNDKYQLKMKEARLVNSILQLGDKEIENFLYLLSVWKKT